MYLPYHPSIPTPSHKTTLWMGELEPWMDEQYIQRLWLNLNAQVIVKVIRDKTTFVSSGYAFVDFGSISAAQCALDMFNGEVIPNTSCTFKLNWASGGGLVDRKEDRQPEYSVFLGDLSADCTEQILLTIFQSRYRSCKSAKIMTDPRTGLTRGYGFVRFSSQLDQIQALNEMQGFIIGNRPIRVSLATPKNNSTLTTTNTMLNNYESLSPTFNHSTLIQQQQQQQQQQNQSQQNTTVFVGGLSCPLQEDELRQYFSIFGEIIYVKIPPGKGCGFVQFVSRQSAEMAIDQMNGYQIGSSRIRLSWGRSQNQQQIAQQQLQLQQQQQQQQQAQLQLQLQLQQQQLLKQELLLNDYTNNRNNNMLLTSSSSFSSPKYTSSSNMISMQHPFDEDKGFMSVFDSSNHFANDNNSFFVNTSSVTTSTTTTATTLKSPIVSNKKSSTAWSSDYHIFAQ